VACGCLGIVALGYVGARIFQSYQSWRFDRVIGHQAPSQKSFMTGWMDRALSALMEEPAAKLNRDRFQTNAPATSTRGSVPGLPMGSLVGRIPVACA
jgi:hypothetical protein